MTSAKLQKGVQPCIAKSEVVPRTKRRKKAALCTATRATRRITRLSVYAKNSRKTCSQPENLNPETGPGAHARCLPLGIANHFLPNELRSDAKVDRCQRRQHQQVSAVRWLGWIHSVFRGLSSSRALCFASSCCLVRYHARALLRVARSLCRAAPPAPRPAIVSRARPQIPCSSASAATHCSRCRPTRCSQAEAGAALCWSRSPSSESRPELPEHPGARGKK
mmetsp:Transcript_25738/g.56743  ORF Transcript_25738/g.56743 Transcript_25738/m.56743 type:complete len:222 (-) Transcript_25738:956-1621(-)